MTRKDTTILMHHVIHFDARTKNSELKTVDYHNITIGCDYCTYCGRADSVLDSQTTGPGFKTLLARYFLLSFQTVDHHDRIKLSVRWCVWKAGEGFPGRVSPKTLKWVAVYSSVTFHING